MRCCDCEFINECKEKDTVLTCFVKCNIREEKLKQKAEQGKMLNGAEGYIKKSSLLDAIGDMPWFTGYGDLTFEQHQILFTFVNCLKTEIKKIPTADVVPKSEVEMWQGALKAEELHNELTMEMAKKALTNAKAEVAREIFEEIEKAICGITAKNAIECTFEIDRIEYIELKKKYTEGASE